MAYKPDTDVVEQSQGVMIAAALADAGHAVMIADPCALAAASAVLGERVTPFGDAAAAIAAARCVVIATPAAAYRALPAQAFATGPRRVVLDCWRVLPAEIGAVADVVYLGVGPSPV